MDKFDEIAEREGVYLAPFTGQYLALYDDGVGLLERFIRENKVEGEVLYISTTEIKEFVKKGDRQVTLDG